MLAAHGVTHTGTVRPHNEDAILVDLSLGLFIVADGMGGVNAGEVASQMAVEAIRSFVARGLPDDDDHDDDRSPLDAEPGLSRQANRLQTAVKLANRSIHRAGNEREEYTGMGTTVAAVLVDGRTAFICGVGDSRVYSAAAGRVTQLTVDHTWVEAIRTQDPTIDPIALARHPMRHVLTAVVGGHDTVNARVLEHPLADDERLVICSDGVYRGVSDDLLGRLAAEGSVKQAAEAIVNAALELDGRDNISVVVVERTN